MSVASTESNLTIQNVRITPGGIYCLRDELVRLPDSDARKVRTLHDWRTVLVMSSAAVCHSNDYGCVLIAPMSHIVKYCAGVDLIINPNQENKLDAPGRVLLSYIQPAVKTDIQGSRMIGVMSYDDWQAIMAALIAGIDH